MKFQDRKVFTYTIIMEFFKFFEIQASKMGLPSNICNNGAKKLKEKHCIGRAIF